PFSGPVLIVDPHLVIVHTIKVGLRQRLVRLGANPVDDVRGKFHIVSCSGIRSEGGHRRRVFRGAEYETVGYKRAVLIFVDDIFSIQPSARLVRRGEGGLESFSGPEIRLGLLLVFRYSNYK